MAELEKIVRVLKKFDPTAPHATLLVLDATVGQNALSQVELFQKTAGVTGLVMTKLDGTARGGILVALAAKFGLPVHFIGVGEGVEDLEPFAARDFARAIAGLRMAERDVFASGTAAHLVRRLARHAVEDLMTDRKAAYASRFLKLALELGPLVAVLLRQCLCGPLRLSRENQRIFVATGIVHRRHVDRARRQLRCSSRKLPIMPLVSGVVVVVFGGLTLVAAGRCLHQAEAHHREHAFRADRCSAGSISASPCCRSCSTACSS